MLKLDGVTAGYGHKAVLRDVSLQLGENEIVAVVGANGAGKTTMLRAISGEIRPFGGTIEHDGERIDGLPAYLVARRGVAHVLEGRHVFRALSIEDNLRVACLRGTPRRTVEQRLRAAYKLFPVLGERRRLKAALLSGGQQQMLVIARALMDEPNVLLIDEPSLGLAPIAIQAIEQALRALMTAGNVSVLLVEQTIAIAQTVANRGLVMRGGHLTSLPALGELKREELAAAYLGGSGADAAIG